MTERYPAGRGNGTPRVATVAGGAVHLSSAHGLGARAGRSADRLGDRLIQAGERGEELLALLLQPADHRVVLPDPALPLVEPARLQDLDVVDPGQGRGHLVAEVRVGHPFDGVLDDGLDDRGGVGNRHLLRHRLVRAADPAGVEHEDLHLNTGRIGGTDEAESKKVTIPNSSAIVQAIVEDTIEWVTDPDFGYEMAASLPGVDDVEILQPRRLYERQGRVGEYDAMVSRLKKERKEFLASFAGLDETITKSIR